MTTTTQMTRAVRGGSQNAEGVDSLDGDGIRRSLSGAGEAGPVGAEVASEDQVEARVVSVAAVPSAASLAAGAVSAAAVPAVAGRLAGGQNLYRCLSETNRSVYRADSYVSSRNASTPICSSRVMFC